MYYDPNTEPHRHIDNLDTGEVTAIDASQVEVAGLRRLPDGSFFCAASEHAG